MATDYAARLDIDYPEQSNRVTTLFRLVLAIPILMVLSLLSGPSASQYVDQAGKDVSSGRRDVAGGQ